MGLNPNQNAPRWKLGAPQPRRDVGVAHPQEYRIRPGVIHRSAFILSRESPDPYRR
jgi:hypothetical protein